MGVTSVTRGTTLRRDRRNHSNKGCWYPTLLPLLVLLLHKQATWDAVASWVLYAALCVLMIQDEKVAGSPLMLPLVLLPPSCSCQGANQHSCSTSTHHLNLTPLAEGLQATHSHTPVIPKLHPGPLVLHTHLGGTNPTTRSRV